MINTVKSLESQEAKIHNLTKVMLADKVECSTRAGSTNPQVSVVIVTRIKEQVTDHRFRISLQETTPSQTWLSIRGSQARRTVALFCR